MVIHASSPLEETSLGFMLCSGLSVSMGEALYFLLISDRPNGQMITIPFAFVSINVVIKDLHWHAIVSSSIKVVSS
jgi:hypothetical protein